MNEQQLRSFSLVIPVGRPEREVDMSRQIAGLTYPGHRVETIFIRGKNPPGQRNRGARQAHGEYLVFLDDDIQLPTDLLTKLNLSLAEDESPVVGGANIGFTTGNSFQKMTDVAFSSPFGFGKGHVRFKNWGSKQPGSDDNLTACLLCVQKDVFINIGGFDSSLYPGEEIDLLRRLQKKGVAMTFNPGWFVYHQRRSTLLALGRQVFSYGRARVKIWAKHGFRPADVSYLLPLVLTIYIFLLPGALFLEKWAAAGFFLYLFVLAAVSLTIPGPGCRKFHNKLLLVVILAAIHISYGLGMMRQLVRGVKHGTCVCA